MGIDNNVPSTTAVSLSLLQPANPNSRISKVTGVDVMSMSAFADNAEVGLGLLMAGVNTEIMKDQIERTRQTSKMKRDVQLESWKKQDDSIQKMADAKHRSIFAKIFGWIATLFAAIVGALAIVATGGAATPAVAALMVLAVWQLSAQITTEATHGEKNIGLDAVCGKLFYGLAKMCGASEDDAKKAEMFGGMALAMVISVAVPAGLAYATSRAVSAGTKAASAGGSAAEAGGQGGQFSSACVKAAAQLEKLADNVSNAAFKLLLKSISDSFKALGQSTKKLNSKEVSLFFDGLENKLQKLMKGKMPRVNDEGLTESRFMLLKMQRWAAAGEIVGTAGESAVTLVGAFQDKAAADAQAEFMESLALLNFVSAMLDQEKDKLDAQAKELKSIHDTTSKMMDSNSETEASITNNFCSISFA